MGAGRREAAPSSRCSSPSCRRNARRNGRCRRRSVRPACVLRPPARAPAGRRPAARTPARRLAGAPGGSWGDPRGPFSRRGRRGRGRSAYGGGTRGRSAVVGWLCLWALGRRWEVGGGRTWVRTERPPGTAPQRQARLRRALRIAVWSRKGNKGCKCVFWQLFRARDVE